ncbi:MAG TPA: amino acid racemase [Nitrospira sp.]
MAIKHIGIVAGTTEGAALCYRVLSECAAAETIRPEITLHAFHQSTYLDLVERDDWDAIAALMSQSALALVRAGAELIICPNNTLHRAFDLVKSPVPWLHIADVVAAEAARRRYRHVGLLGTQVVSRGTIYSDKLTQRNIELYLPDEKERAQIQHIIRNELIDGRCTEPSRSYLLNVISRLAKKGAEAVILACTELPLLLTQDLTDLPLLDSTRLLARAALGQMTDSTRDLPDHRISTSASL